MYYICDMRTMIRTKDFDDFYNSLPSNIQNKVKYAMNIIADGCKGRKYKISKEAYRYRLL